MQEVLRRPARRHARIGRFQRDEEDPPDRRDQADDQEGLGLKLTCLDRTPHGMQDLDEHQHEQKVIDNDHDQAGVQTVVKQALRKAHGCDDERQQSREHKEGRDHDGDPPLGDDHQSGSPLGKLLGMVFGRLQRVAHGPMPYSSSNGASMMAGEAWRRRRIRCRVNAVLILAFLAALAAAQPAAPPATDNPRPAAKAVRPVTEGDFAIHDFRFGTGETLPALRMHYRTLGSPHRDATGAIDNAVMILHGTGGDGAQFLQPQFADELYGPGQPLDTARYWIILPDNIGHGRSSKPSDGPRMRFPRYDYADMVEAQRRLLTEGLGVRRLRLILGTSMGCMHIFIWGEAHPDFARALMPMACEPVTLAGLNRMWRRMAIDGIERDPAWLGGNYHAEPIAGLRTAESLLVMAGAAPLNFQKRYPSRDEADAFVERRMAGALESAEANDLIYQLDASRNYDPWPGLERMTAPVMWLNSADDFINPRNLTFPEQAVKRMPNARFRLIPESAETHGHGTHTWARFWKADLSELLARTEAPPR